MNVLDFQPPGIHEDSLREYFGERGMTRPTRPEGGAVTIMLFVNRCGSTLLGEYLRASGRFSGFGEPLGHELVVERCEKHGLDSLGAYLHWLLENIRQPGTQFGMKLSLDQVEMLYRVGLLPGMLPRINWVYVYRRDILGQAISFSIAAQTGAWKSTDQSAQNKVAFDYDDIKARAEEIALRYYHISRFLTLNGIDAYQLAYEEFLQDPLGHSLAIARTCGEKVETIDTSRLSMERQSSPLNRQFRDQFLEAREQEQETAAGT